MPFDLDTSSGMIFKNLFFWCILHWVTNAHANRSCSFLKFQGNHWFPPTKGKSYKGKTGGRRRRKKFLGYNWSWKTKPKPGQGLTFYKNPICPRMPPQGAPVTLTFSVISKSLFSRYLWFTIHCVATHFLLMVLNGCFTKEKQEGIFLSKFRWLHHFLLLAFKISGKA